MAFTPVTFSNKGEALFGIIEQVKSCPKSVGVLFLHGWGGYRIGPQRLFVECARAFVKQGIPSLRFDFRGRGESEGEGVTLVDMIEDVAVACDVLIEHCGVDKIVLFGICSGGEVAVGAATTHPAIVGCILCSTPVLGRQEEEKGGEKVKKVSRNTQGYIRKLFLKETWKKFITFNINYRLILRIICNDLNSQSSCEVARSVQWYLEQFRTLFSGNVLFIYGANDPITTESLEKYKEICATHSMTYRIVQEANHNFYGWKWRQELISYAVDFIEKYY